MSIIYSIRWYWCRLRETRWRVFFKVNGPRQWDYIEFSGMRELSYSPALVGYWHGRTNTGDLYAWQVRTDVRDLIPRRDPTEAMLNLSRERVEEAKKHMDGYLLPDCRCRVGFHWKCSIHERWVN